MTERTTCPKIAVLCVGNKLMLDDGVGCAVYDEMVEGYVFPDSVDLFDVGCMSLDMLNYVRDYELIVTVDAVDGSGEPVGTLFRFTPDEMMRHPGGVQSLHDIKLVDLFDAAALLEYEAEGLCLGMQIENRNPAEVTIGLTPVVHEALPRLVDLVLAELTRAGATIYPQGSSTPVGPHHQHSKKGTDPQLGDQA